MLKKIFSLGLAFAIVMSFGNVLVVKADVSVVPVDELADMSAVPAFDFEKTATIGISNTSSQPIDNSFTQNVTVESNITVKVVHEDGTTMCEDPSTCAADKNHVLEIPGGNTTAVGDKISFRYLSMYGFGKATADFKLSTVNNGKLELFAWTTGYSFAKTGRGIVIDSGTIKAFNLDVDPSQMISFGQEKAIAAESWYTIERYFDFRIAGKNYSRFIIKEKDGGSVIADSDWIWMSSVPGNYFLLSQFYVEEFQDTDFVTLDNIRYWQYNNLPTVKVTAPNNPAENNYLRVDQNGYVGISYYNYQDQGVIRDRFRPVEYHRWEQKILFTGVGETLNASIYTYAHSAWIDAQKIGQFLKIIDGDLYYFEHDGEKWLDAKPITGITLEANKWYKFRVDYKGKIRDPKKTEDPDPADPSVTDANIYIYDENETELVKIENVKVKPMYLNPTGDARAGLGFVHGNFSNHPIYIDDVKITCWDTAFDDENPKIFFETDWDDHDIGESATSVVAKEMAERFTSYPTYTYVAQTQNDAVFVSEKSMFDGAVAPVKPKDVTFIFSQPMATDTFTTDNVKISTFGEFIPPTSYSVTPVADAEQTQFKVKFLAPLVPQAQYKLSLSNKIIDKEKHGVMANNALTQEYAFETGTDMESVEINSVVFKDEHDSAYATTKKTLNSGDKIKAVANISVNEAPINYTVMLCIYHENRLKQVGMISGISDVTGNIDAETTMLTNDVDGATAKAFVWDTLATMGHLGDIRALGED